MLSSFPAGKSLFWLVLSALQLQKINGDVPGGLPECFPNSTNATVYRFLPPNRHHFLTSRPRSAPLLLSVSRLDKHKHTRVEPSCSLKDLHPAVFIHTLKHRSSWTVRKDQSALIYISWVISLLLNQFINVAISSQQWQQDYSSNSNVSSLL